MQHVVSNTIYWFSKQRGGLKEMASINQTHEHGKESKGGQSSTHQANRTATVTGRLSSKWWALAVIAMAQLMVVMDTAIMAVALPSAQSALGMSDTMRQWVFTAYTLT